MVPINLSINKIVEDPNCDSESERWHRFGQDDHVRLYSKQGFVDRATEAGFTVEQLGQHDFGITTFLKNGISQQSILYVVNKT